MQGITMKISRLPDKEKSHNTNVMVVITTETQSRPRDDMMNRMTKVTKALTTGQPYSSLPSAQSLTPSHFQEVGIHFLESSQVKRLPQSSC